jgi:hypothetical protein
LKADTGSFTEFGGVLAEVQHCKRNDGFLGESILGTLRISELAIEQVLPSRLRVNLVPWGIKA